MAINYPGPYEVRINYTVNIAAVPYDHQQRFSCVMNIEGGVGDPFSDFIPVQTNGSAVTTLDSHMETWTDLLQDYFTSSGVIVDVELWKYTAGTFDATWYSAKTINKTGTGTGSMIRASEQIFTIRSDNGGIMRAHFEEGRVAAGVKDTLPLADAELDLLADHIMSDNNIFVARDGGYPAVFIAMYPGNNEAIFKKRYRA